MEFVSDFYLSFFFLQISYQGYDQCNTPKKNQLVSSTYVPCLSQVMKQTTSMAATHLPDSPHLIKST